LPFLALNALVVLGPACATVYYAFTDWNGLSTPHFTGLDNFRTLLRDTVFLNALRHNLVYIVFMLIVPTSMALFGAFMLTRIKRFRMTFRTLYFIPFFVASVVNGAIWKYLLSPGIGIAAGLNKIGIHWLDDTYFLGDTKLSLLTVAFVDNWQWWGFLVVLFLAAMQDVSPSLYESARLDGAGRWQEFRHVTLPAIRPTVVFVVMLSIIWSFLAFDYAFVLTGGGPADSSMLMAILVNRNAFQLNQAGYASAMGLLMTGLTVSVIAIFTILRRRGWEV
jgi:raffinose/stachyose/melibiose transport system permease protein